MTAATRSPGRTFWMRSAPTAVTVPRSSTVMRLRSSRSTSKVLGVAGSSGERARSSAGVRAMLCLRERAGASARSRRRVNIVFLRQQKMPLGFGRFAAAQSAACRIEFQYSVVSAAYRPNPARFARSPGR